MYVKIVRENTMTPAKRCKEIGLSGLSEVCKATKQSPQCLDNWFKNKPELFDIIIKGVLFHKNIKVFDKNA